MMGGRFGTMEARTATAGAKFVHIESTWPGTMTMTYRRAAYFNAGEARRREINCVVRFAVSCDNGVASGDQIFDSLIRSCVGEGFGHSPRWAQLVH